MAPKKGRKGSSPSPNRGPVRGGKKKGKDGKDLKESKSAPVLRPPTPPPMISLESMGFATPCSSPELQQKLSALQARMEERCKDLSAPSALSPDYLRSIDAHDQLRSTTTFNLHPSTRGRRAAKERREMVELDGWPPSGRKVTVCLYYYDYL